MAGPDRGVYLEDGVRLYRVLESGPKGLLLLENSGAPWELPVAFTAPQLRAFGLRSVRRPAPSEKVGVV